VFLLDLLRDTFGNLLLLFRVIEDGRAVFCSMISSERTPVSTQRSIERTGSYVAPLSVHSRWIVSSVEELWKHIQLLATAK
jgi:hypothetical protein